MVFIDWIVDHWFIVVCFGLGVLLLWQLWLQRGQTVEGSVELVWNLLYPGVLGALIVFWLQRATEHGLPWMWSAVEGQFGTFVLLFFVGVYAQVKDVNSRKGKNWRLDLVATISDTLEVILMFVAYHLLGFMESGATSQLSGFYVWFSAMIGVWVIARLIKARINDELEDHYMDGLCIAALILLLAVGLGLGKDAETAHGLWILLLLYFLHKAGWQWPFMRGASG